MAEDKTLAVTGMVIGQPNRRPRRLGHHRGLSLDRSAPMSRQSIEELFSVSAIPRSSLVAGSLADLHPRTGNPQLKGRACPGLFARDAKHPRYAQHWAILVTCTNIGGITKASICRTMV